MDLTDASLAATWAATAEFLRDKLQGPYTRMEGLSPQAAAALNAMLLELVQGQGGAETVATYSQSARHEAGRMLVQNSECSFPAI